MKLSARAASATDVCLLQEPVSFIAELDTCVQHTLGHTHAHLALEERVWDSGAVACHCKLACSMGPRGQQHVSYSTTPPSKGPLCTHPQDTHPKRHFRGWS